MIKDDERIKDWRSTGRKRLRRILLKLVEEGELEYNCNHCGHVPSIPWSVPTRSGDFLDANHKNGNYRDNDPANGEFLCRDCHYAYDRRERLEKEAREEFSDPFGYGVNLRDYE